MEHSQAQPLQQQLAKASHVLIALPTMPSTDAIASGLALSAFLQKMGKTIELVAHDFRLPSHHEFLGRHETIQQHLSASNQFVISVKVGDARVKELSYDLQDDTLKIFLSPEKGKLTERDVSSSAAQPKHSLIIVLDALDLSALGPLFEENTDFFYSTPIVNIDHHSGNTHFGQMNFVELTATATAEVLFDLVKALDVNGVTAPMATQLLAGIMAKTHAFRSPIVTPKTLTTASDLLSRGAKQDDIVRHLFQSKSIATLRLWGRILARLQNDFDGRLVWSRVLRMDFAKAGAEERDVEGVLQELLGAAPEATIAVIVYESSAGLVAQALALPAVDVFRVFRDFHPESHAGGARLHFSTETPDVAEEQLRAAVKKYFAGT